MTKQEALKKYFGYDSFRSGQEVLVDGILEEEIRWALCPPVRENLCAIRFRRF